jgi:Mrp family chromosome partitioning ATPase
VDGVVMVAVAGETNRKAIELALSTLRRLRANVLGLVLNEITSDSSEGYYYHGYYGKYYKYYNSGKE